MEVLLICVMCVMSLGFNFLIRFSMFLCSAVCFMFFNFFLPFLLYLLYIIFVMSSNCTLCEMKYM